MQAFEVEYFRLWIEQANRLDYQEKERHLLRLAGSLGARHLNVAVFERHTPETIIRNLRDLYRRARHIISLYN